MLAYYKNFSLLFISMVLFKSCAAIQGIPDPGPKGMKVVKVEQVIDGDTFKLEDQTIVRLIGIDSPESYPGKPDEPYAGVAKQVLEKLVLGKKVILEFGKEKLDPYKRTLAYVYVVPGISDSSSRPVTYNGYLFVNAYLVKMGHAVPRRYSTINDDYEMLLFDQLIDAQNYRRGIWAEKWDDSRYKSKN